MNVRGRLFKGIAAVMMAGASLSAVVGVALVAGASVVAASASAAAAPFAVSGQSAQVMRLSGSQEGTADGYRRVLATNWSGYAQHTKNKGTFTAVEDTWKVPKVVTRKSGKQYASDWVGIGGYSEGTLVQAGTTEWNDNGRAHYNAWTEVLPYQEVRISGLRIRPGDMVKAIVRETKKDVWVMTVKNLTTGRSDARTVHYRSSGQSAEAIHERPEVGRRLSTLATTNNVRFDPGNFGISRPGHTVWRPLLKSITQATLAVIVMVNKNDTMTLATPSAPNSAKRGFAVADGSAPPQPPN